MVLLKFKKHWYNWQEEPSQKDILCKEGIITLFDLFGNLNRTNIRYGVVFSSESVGFNDHFSFIPQNLSFINYTNKQLTDKETQVYGKVE